MKIAFAICCVFAFGKAYPVEDNNLMKFHSSSPHRSDNFDAFIAHKRYTREIDDSYFGANTYPYPYPYPIPSNPYYEYDAQQGLWRPKFKNSINSNNVFNGYVSNSGQRYRLRQRYLSRANRRQGNNGVYTRGGHSPTFEALRGAIAFG